MKKSDFYHLFWFLLAIGLLIAAGSQTGTPRRVLDIAGSMTLTFVLISFIGKKIIDSKN